MASSFRTVVEPLRGHVGTITHSTPLLMLGSCFSDNIGQRLADRLFNTMVNPFGQLYNAASIERALALVAANKTYRIDDLLFDGTRYHSFDHHSRFSHNDSSIVLERANASIAECRAFLKECDVAILTLGTSYIFVDRDSRNVVANCHKLPASRFERVALNAGDTATSLRHSIELMRSFNPAMKIVLTVSPIRHLADGARANNLSKASLLAATKIIEESVDNTVYFPAYEIMVDDLRDYRFYAADMVHPSETAVDYIYELFEASFFSPATMQFAKQCLNFAKRLRHRPNTPPTAADIERKKAELESQRSQLAAHCPTVAIAIDKLLNLNEIDNWKYNQ